jgi:hypothetical protein
MQGSARSGHATALKSEPAQVGPWTRGRNKVDPKPLDNAAFSTLVTPASEVLRRHEKQLHASLYKSMAIGHADGTITVTLTIILDEGDPRAVLAATDAFGEGWRANGSNLPSSGRGPAQATGSTAASSVDILPALGMPVLSTLAPPLMSNVNPSNA